jgi:hypothetical protein
VSDEKPPAPETFRIVHESVSGETRRTMEFRTPGPVRPRPDPKSGLDLLKQAADDLSNIVAELSAGRITPTQASDRITKAGEALREAGLTLRGEAAAR